MGCKGRMLDREEVPAVTGHSVGRRLSVSTALAASGLVRYFAAALKRGFARAGTGNAALEQPWKGSPS